MSVNGGVHRRLQSVQRDHPRREASYSRRRTITREDAYSFALRAALLHHLLQPRSKRLQHVAAAAKPVRSSTTSATDLIKEFAPLRESKSTKLPHAFMATLDKRLEGVLMGRERMPEYKDALVKRTFAAYLNEFKRPATRKTFEESRRAETLVLVFFAQATKELQKDKSADDDSWKMMVDRHVALLCRLISAILKEQGWAKERPELAAQLATMEKKLLVHDQDLAADSTRNGGAGGYSVEVEVPVSYEVKDMPLVLVVSRMFGVPYAQVQDDINKNKSVWTEKAALQDLKLYQTSLSLNARKTLSSEDFDTEEAYEIWKKAEVHDISQMIFSILQSNIELAKTNTNGAAQLARQVTSPHDSGYSEFGRISGDNTDRNSTPNFEQAIDLSGLNINGDESTPLTFLPSDPRFCYRAVLKECLVYDQMTNETQEGQTIEPQPIKLLSKDSTELLTELALRWRIPQFSRTILFMDVIKERFQNREIDLDTLDAAFNYSKEPPALDKKAKRASVMVQPTFLEWKKWTVTDYAAYQNILNTIHDTLLRDLFDLMMGCYEAKAPSIGPVMYILNEHIYNDELFPREPEELDEFTKRLQEELHERSAQIYRDMLNKDIPTSAKDWQFYNVIQLGKDVVKFADKIQKRYKKTPVIMGVNPLMVLVEEVFPSYAGDARELCARIMQYAEDMGHEIDIQDGFDLYGELVEIRKVHAEVLPEVPFAFEIEGLLQAFVWRWIAATETQIVGWVDEAVRQDPFTPHAQQVGEDTGGHSTSALDMFRSFKESISRIVELNWDDDLSYAKFMTALSKCVGNALARYCELMEQRFVKEMDRLTPEQEAALSRTRQEKWMQLAKDAWANKDKVEPFQFMAESLVKLNNIEYAMLELDKLEKEINVDACAEVIQKNTPPPAQRPRKQEQYVFTIKIIEAEDLKACDMNGLSDPYLVLGDEYQKRLAKTRVIYSNLNPRWDETVDIVTTGPLNIIATIWDWDAFGEHDCVGRASLKLDPSHFRDYMPREYWLDLDTQGRLLLRVSMEGERDDIQFYFGKAFRTLKRTERDMTRKITDKVCNAFKISRVIPLSFASYPRTFIIVSRVNVSSLCSIAMHFPRKLSPL